MFEHAGRQYIVGNDGEPVYGVYFIPEDEARGIIVDARSAGNLEA